MTIPLTGGFARACYRVHQFTRGLRPHLAPGEIAEAREVLSEAEFRLFMGAQARDRRHSVDLYRLLLSAGASRPMLVAALVHDVGKGDIATWQRVAVFLDERQLVELALNVAWYNSGVRIMGALGIELEEGYR